MKYAQFRKYDIANGPGIRCSLFVTGCTHNCPGCFNESYQDFGFGENWNSRIEEQILTTLSQPQISGLTLLGGEPFQNTAGLIPVLKNVRAYLNSNKLKKDIWVYSGYTWEQIITDPIKLELAKLCDVLVDGLFEEKLKSLNLIFRGSSNQRIIDIGNTLKSDRIVELVFE